MRPTAQQRTDSGSFSRDVAKLASASGVAAGIAILATPVITRLFSPEAFGTAAIFASIAFTLGIVSCLRYEMAILLPKENRDAKVLLHLCLRLAFLSAFATAAAVFAWRICLGPGSWSEVYLLLPVAVMLQGLNLSLVRWNARKQDFGSNSLAKIGDAGSCQSLQAGFGGLGLNAPVMLVIGALCGRITSLGVLLRRNWTDLSGTQGVPWKELRAQIVRFRKFPLVDSASALVNTASSHLPLVLLGVLFSPAVAGFFALGFRIIQLPMITLGNAAAQVFFQRYASSADTVVRRRLTLSIFERLVVVALLPMSLLALLGEQTFGLFFGADWIEAGRYAELLSLWGFFWLVSSPLTNIFSVLERQGIALGINLLIFVVRLASLIAGARLGDPFLAIALYSAAGTGLYLVLLLQVFRLTEVSLQAGAHIFTKHLLRVLPCIACVFALSKAITSDLVVILAAAAIACLYFFLHRNLLARVQDASAPGESNSQLQNNP